MSKTIHEAEPGRRRERRWSRDVIVAAILSAAAFAYIALSAGTQRPQPSTVGAVDLEQSR